MRQADGSLSLGASDLLATSKLGLLSAATTYLHYFPPARPHYN